MIIEIEYVLTQDLTVGHVVLTLTVHPVTAVVCGLSKDAVNVVRIHIAREKNSVYVERALIVYRKINLDVALMVIVVAG